MSGQASALRRMGTPLTPPKREPRPPWPPAEWAKRNLFGSVFNTALTFVTLAALALVVPPLLRWAVTNATITGITRAACGPDGACWTFVRTHLPLFLFGRYPAEERWRLGAAALVVIGMAAPLFRRPVQRAGLWVGLLLTVAPALAGLLLAGGVPGLPYVDTSQWGGLMLDVVISYVVVAGSLPFGILLALGRRSQLPVVRALSVGFIELWRGVPLLTVLFMSAVMVPLFLPGGVSVDRLIRAMAALVMFNAAYMAEVVRGGLQGVQPGQDEAAFSLGLHWAQVQALVILPQALRIVVPGIINTVVDLFKDTTLVTIIGLSDGLGAVDQALKDPAWLGFATEGYTFAALMFFVCCFAMSAYGRSMERRLSTGR